MSSNEINNNISDFAKFGLLAANFVRAHPNATSAERLALYDGIFHGVELIHADEKAHIVSAHKNELQAKDAALEEMNKDINDWKEKAEVGATELKKKEGAHAIVLEKTNKEINDWKAKAVTDAATIGELQADKKEWIADKEEWTADKEEWKAEKEQKDEALAAAEQEGKRWKSKYKAIDGKVDEYVVGEEVEREEMEQRHAGELQRAVDQAVAKAVEEKDREIRTLNRKIAVYKRASDASSASV